jgi:DNA-binding response OmpR family regulator
MQISLIGGRSSDARWLARLGAARGHTFLISELAAATSDSEQEPEAFVIHAHAVLDVTRDALRAIRVEPHFQRALAIASLSAEQVARRDASELGFDDFVVRPHSEAEVLERVRLYRRRDVGTGAEAALVFPGFVVDRAGHSVRADGRAVALTAREFALLVHFAARPGRAQSRDDLLREVWGHGYEGGPRTVDIHVRRLRKKLGAALPLETLRGFGYKLDASPEPEAKSGPRDGLSLAV